MRDRDEDDVVQLFMNAYNEDSNLAMKALFYLRDIRGGQGERKTFRTICKALADRYPQSIKKNFAAIAEMGRWDDMLSFEGTALQKDAYAFMEEQLTQDVIAMLHNKPVSLLGKWLPSENTSSKETVRLARSFRTYLEWSPAKYRKTLANLRTQIKVVEQKMSANLWNTIKYENVPSRASMIYRKAFEKHDAEGYAQYLSDVEAGKKDIKASALYPYDVVRLFLKNEGEGARTLEAQWKALPNYIPEGAGNALVVADVSGSMFTESKLPISTSVALAMYFAERNDGLFKNYFITFSAKPTLEKIKGTTLADRIHNLSNADWGGNTNIQAVYQLILNTAVKNKVPQEEMPNRIFIISDMEFDSATSSYSYGMERSKSNTNYSVIKKQYEDNGYKLPLIIFWNVDAKNNQTPVTMDDKGVMLVSGQSPVIFKSVMNSKTVTAFDLMIETLSQERYRGIVA
jgi:hypothetical protein